ncbi:MAG: C45 family autoproteolytic acyltransferase/hydrolase [Nitrososphaerales archaeon]
MTGRKNHDSSVSERKHSSHRGIQNTLGSDIFTFDTKVYPWNSPIPVVFVEGTSSEMGKQFGRATKDTLKKIVRFNAPYLEKLLKESRIKKKDHLSNIEYVISKHTEKEYLDEISSMAEAADVSYGDLLLTNTNIDLLYELPHPESHGPLFCSFFGAWGDATKDSGSVVAGHNDDGGRIMDQFLVLKIARPTHGFSFVSPTVPGYLGYHSMVNSTQTYCCSTGIDDVMKNSQVRNDGLPGWVLFRWLGQFSENTEDAVRRFLSVPNRTCINWCFTSIKQGSRIVEATPKHHAFPKYPGKTKDWIVSAGRTLCPELYPWLVKGKHPTMGDYRYESIKKVVSKNYGKIDSDVGVEIMSDHYDSKVGEVSASENTVCRHMEFAGRFAGTCRSLVVNFLEKEREEDGAKTEISVSLGNPCYGYWRRIGFNDEMLPISGLAEKDVAGVHLRTRGLAAA